jgi:hypothetical protein
LSRNPTLPSVLPHGSLGCGHNGGRARGSWRLVGPDLPGVRVREQERPIVADPVVEFDFDVAALVDAGHAVAERAVADIKQRAGLYICGIVLAVADGDRPSRLGDGVASGA